LCAWDVFFSAFSGKRLQGKLVTYYEQKSVLIVKENKRKKNEMKTMHESELRNTHIEGMIFVLAENDSGRGGDDKDMSLRYLVCAGGWKMFSTALVFLPVERSDVLLLSFSIWREVDSAKSQLSI